MNYTFLSREVDYLNVLSSALRNLQGYHTLIHEMIQNADDAKNASEMVFDIYPDALIVDNNGSFTDCGKVEESTCPWKIQHGYRCDFHRLRMVMSGDKRAENDTTGAFGIGFTVVYQITDNPELISSGRHWILHEEKLANERIKVCNGCPKCQTTHLPGTRFILPLARNPNSELRKALQIEPVAEDFTNRIFKVLKQSLPVAMIFLKRLNKIVIRRNGTDKIKFERYKEKDSLIITDGEPKNDRVWYILHGEFKETADKLKDEHKGRIETKRSASVAVAISDIPQTEGLLCATLPTEHSLGLPFHINADFFTKTDRKRLILDNDYQSQWNREALKTAALTLGQKILQLRDLLQPSRFWDIMETLHDIAKTNKEEASRTFWEVVEPELLKLPVIYTTDERWVMCAEAFILKDLKEKPIIPILEGLGINVVHEDLRPYHRLLQSLGVQILDVEMLCGKLEAIGLTKRTKYNELPIYLRKLNDRIILWEEISRLLKRTQRNSRMKNEDKERLSHLAIAPGRDGALWPCKEIYYTDDESTIELFQTLKIPVPFLDNIEAFRHLKSLCSSFDVMEAIRTLEQLEQKKLEVIWKQGHLTKLFTWFAKRKKKIKKDESICKKLASLPLYPSSSGLHSLDKLSLPGKFEDPLGLAEIIDVKQLGGHDKLLLILGIRKLTFEDYVLKHLPLAFSDFSKYDRDKRWEIVKLLARKLEDLKKIKGARETLKDIPFVKCINGTFYKAQQCYFDEPIVRQCLGDDVPIAILPTAKKLRDAVRKFYNWLGVEDRPRLDEIINVIKNNIASQPYSHHAIQRLTDIIKYLGENIDLKDHSRNQSLISLRSMKWLPASGKKDGWYAPYELYSFHKEHLFKSQALFLDIPKKIQESNRQLLDFIGINIEPEPELVVNHLIYCIPQSKPVTIDLYCFLNNYANDPCIEKLKNYKCLWLDGTYCHPRHVFWNEHRFGRYRKRLNDEFYQFSNLLSRLGVRDVPNHEDALSVLKEISEEFGKPNKPLDDEAYKILMMCWKILQEALEFKNINEEKIYHELHQIKSIPRKDRILEPPKSMYFENRAGLGAKFGDFLENNLISYPLDCGKAMSAAGVKHLSTDVEIELIECKHPKEDNEFKKRILERRNEIARVLNRHITDESNFNETLSNLNKIKFMRVNSLKIRYRLNAFQRHLISKEDEVLACYDQKTKCLFFVFQDDAWSTIACELALALYPKKDPSLISSGLQTMLMPTTRERAKSDLDKLGYPPVEIIDFELTQSMETAGSLGMELSPLNESQAMSTEVDGLQNIETRKHDVQQPSQTMSAALPPKDSVAKSSETISPQPDEKTESLHIEISYLQGQSEVDKIANRENKEYKTMGTLERYGSFSGNKRKVFISYVAVDPNDKPPYSDEMNWLKKKKLEEKAIKFILTHEPKWKQPCSSSNRGYDLYETNDNRQPIRYCEVKAMKGTLQDYPVCLSKTQFEFAQKHRHNYWLYIVECVDTDKPRIIRIQDPFGKARNFTFDHGWIAVAEINKESIDTKG